MTLILLLFSSLLTTQTSSEHKNQRLTKTVIAVKKVSPAVVSIYAQRRVRSNPFGFGLNKPNSTFGASNIKPVLGSGIIISSDGYVVTNEHIVTKSWKLKVKLQNGKILKAKVVGTDKKLDIALLKITKKGKYVSAKLGNSNKILIGETVIAIGNPYGLSSSVSRGIVSALHRNLVIGKRLYPNVIQTDTAINPGNSGGALINILGEVIGITSVIRKHANSIGFAVPINQVKKVVKELKNFGKTRAIYMGIRVKNHKKGVLITKIFKDGPFAKAKIKPNTVLYKLKRYKIDNLQDFTRALSTLVPGETIKIKTSRGTKKITISYLKAKKALQIFSNYLGVKLKNSSSAGVVIIKILYGSTAASLGLKTGDLITRINRKKLKNLKSLAKYLSFVRPGNSIYTIIKRNGYNYPLTIPY